MERNTIIRSQRNIILRMRLVLLMLILNILFGVVLIILGYIPFFNIILIASLGYFTGQLSHEIHLEKAKLAIHRYLLEPQFQDKYDRENKMGKYKEDEFE